MPSSGGALSSCSEMGAAGWTAARCGMHPEGMLWLRGSRWPLRFGHLQPLCLPSAAGWPFLWAVPWRKPPYSGEGVVEMVGAGLGEGGNGDICFSPLRLCHF